MLKRKIRLLTAIILIMSVFIGCQSNKNEETKKENKEGAEITLMIPDWGAPTEEMLAEFKAETGITVKVLPTAWDDTKSKISIAAAGKKAAADVIEVDWSWVGEFQNAGWLEPLEVDETTQKDIPSVSYFKVGNQIYAVPYANGLRLAYINKDMLSKAGISEYPKTWTEAEAVFDKLKRNKITDYPMLFPLNAEEKTTTSFLTLAYTRNGKVFNNDDTLNKESALDTLQLIKKYIDKGYINPASVSTPGIDTFRGINNAQGAFLIGPTSFITSSNDPKVSKVVGQITTIPVPGIDGPAKQTITFTEAVGVSAYSQNKEAAKKFVEWFSRPEIQLKLNKAINNTPTRTSVIEQMVKEGIIKTPGSIVEQSKIVASPFPNGVPKYYTKMSTEIFNIINQLGQGKLTPEEAANKMKEKVNELVKLNK
jgi:sugar ABC transporter substrate-binding protein